MHLCALNVWRQLRIYFPEKKDDYLCDLKWVVLYERHTFGLKTTVLCMTILYSVAQLFARVQTLHEEQTQSAHKTKGDMKTNSTLSHAVLLHYIYVTKFQNISPWEVKLSRDGGTLRFTKLPKRYFGLCFIVSGLPAGRQANQTLLHRQGADFTGEWNFYLDNGKQAISKLEKEPLSERCFTPTDMPHRHLAHLIAKYD